MPRESIAMALEESVDFLKTQRWVALGTLEPDGAPWSDAAAFALEGCTLYFKVPVGSRSRANIQRDDRVCCATDQWPSYYEIKGVTAHGRARRVTGGEASRAEAALAGVPDPVEPGASMEMALYAIPLDDLVAFDFAKIKRKV